MDLFNSWLVETPIAHRGLHDKDHPENSISAFARAIDEGYPIELDVQLIADGTVVVFHDHTVGVLIHCWYVMPQAACHSTVCNTADQKCH